MNIDELNKLIQQEATQCVRCGLCLPHCPTYSLDPNEGESPRGRIALMSGLASGQLSLTKQTAAYLDHCLTCRACEAVCPAQVNYGKLIDQHRHAQNLLSSFRQSKKSLPSLLSLCLSYPILIKLLAQLVKIHQRLGLAKTINALFKSTTFRRAYSYLPVIKSVTSFQDFYPALHKEHARVALFTGCIASILDQETHRASIKILNYLGYGVYVPKTQRCCGALHLHAGFAETTKQLIKKNLKAFTLPDIQAIITNATGCGAMLQEYVLQNNSASGQIFSQKACDINYFLTGITWPATIKLRPLAKRIAVHTPCTLRNVLQKPSAPLELLQKIPQAEIFALTNNPHCCGAAGLYFLEQAEIAEELANKIVTSITTNTPPDIIVTTNIGCRLQIVKKLLERGLPIPVLHPVELLANQLYQDA